MEKSNVVSLSKKEITTDHNQLATDLRALATEVELGNVGYKTLICIPAGSVVQVPSVMGDDLNFMELVGTLEITKNAVLEVLFDAEGEEDE